MPEWSRISSKIVSNAGILNILKYVLEKGDIWRRNIDAGNVTQNIKKEVSNLPRKSQNYLNSSESHQLCLEHHGLLICVHLQIYHATNSPINSQIHSSVVKL